MLLGPAGSGKSEALRLLLQLVPGRGVALFRGRPVQRIPHPAREIGVLLGDVPAHPARTARGQLRMLTAVAGVPLDRADEVLDLVGLSGLADQRLGDFSLGMERRLGMAAALLGDPHTLVLDEPTRGLSPREATWLNGLLRGYARQGGLVLATSRDPRQTARTADRVVSVDRGRLVADQTAADFSRTRLRPRVAVRTPHAERFAAVLSQEARGGERSGGGRGAMEVVCESGSRVSVYGSDCAAVGESAYRHGILVHLLADEVGEVGDRSGPGPLNRADGRAAWTEPGSPEPPAEGGEKEADGAGAGACPADHGVPAAEKAVAQEEEEAAGSAGHACVPAPGSYKPGGSAPGSDGAAAEGGVARRPADRRQAGGGGGRARLRSGSGRAGAERGGAGSVGRAHHGPGRSSGSGGARGHGGGCGSRQRSEPAGAPGLGSSALRPLAVRHGSDAGSFSGLRPGARLGLGSGAGSDLGDGGTGPDGVARPPRKAPTPRRPGSGLPQRSRTGGRTRPRFSPRPRKVRTGSRDPPRIRRPGTRRRPGTGHALRQAASPVRPIPPAPTARPVRRSRCRLWCADRGRWRRFGTN